MMGDNQKDCKILFKIEADLLSKYKSLCDKNGYDMSKRLRKFIEYEIVVSNSDLNLIKELDRLVNKI
jgi:hypothetical protein